MWFTADTHFFHRNVITYGNRPWRDVNEMAEGLIQRWNKRVKNKQHVYVLGDFSFGGTKKTQEVLKRLNGYKILVRGNHDPRARKLFEWGFDEVLENERLRIGDHNCLLSHFPWLPIKGYGNLPSGKPHVALCRAEDTRYIHKRIIDCGKHWLIHGHVHTAWKIRAENRMINVGVDVWDWEPVHHDTLKKIIGDASGV